MPKRNKQKNRKDKKAGQKGKVPLSKYALKRQEQAKERSEEKEKRKFPPKFDMFP